MQKYLNQHNKSINDTFILPNTIVNYDKDTLLATIIRRYATLPTLYEDPDWFYEECSAWWDENKFAFEKMWKAMETEYNPLENYNRTETREGEFSNSGSNSGLNSSSTIVDGETKGTGTVTNATTINEATTNTDDSTTTNNLTDEHQVSAFDSATYQAKEKDLHTGTVTLDDDQTSTRQASNSNTETRNTKDEVDSTTTVSGSTSGQHSDSGTDSYELHATGNIGVTTNQRMLESELMLRKKYNLYKIMANTFCDDLCLGIW